MALIGCGTLTLLLGVAAVVFLFKANDMLAWTLRQIESQLDSRMPADVTTEERTRLASAFEGARAAVRSGRLDPKALQALQSKLSRLGMEGSTRPSRAEILALAEVLERVAAAPDTEAAPSASPAPSPTATSP